MFRGKFTGLNANVVKQERSQIKDLSFHLKKLAIKEHIKPKDVRRKDTVKSRNQWNRKPREKSP